MEKRTKLERLMEFLATDEVVEVNEEVVTEVMVDIVLKDGVVLVVAEDGTVTIEGVVAEDGDYVAEDDSIIVIKDGKIVEEEVDEEDVVVDAPAEEEMSEEVVEAVEEAVENVEEVVVEEEVVEEDENEARMTILEDTVLKLVEELEDMKGKFSKFSALPADEETTIQAEFSKGADSNLTTLEKYAKIMRNK